MNFSNPPCAPDIKPEHQRHLDIFFDSELYKNPFGDRLTPPQCIVSAKERQEILTMYNIKLVKGEYPGMPLVPTTDPAIKFLGARRDEMIRTEQPCYTQILPDGSRPTIPSYRYVVAVPGQ